MNANTSRHSPAEWDESDQLLSRTARDLPTGRHQFHKERLMAQIHQNQLDERPTATESAAPARTRRFRLPRPAIVLPAMAAALAAAVVAGVTTQNGGGVRDAGVATGPALTTQIGAATTKGLPSCSTRSRWRRPRARDPARPSSPASTSTSSPRRPTRS